ncbi:SufE family protein [Terricaulis silvestris]|uniref:Cysteine desulfuration protein SufE n=1 Tax=Terricaulis silvestris TaxID=2686094 RepID=A0A6I6MLP7_9CAUL|nr:SufE family protein [Terricaulis silvestris]QGZ95599.1 Cysteine desulfuration protein SufE [Terricaulis silvestris]
MPSADQAIQDLADEFALLPDWEERISHVIELARSLEPLRDDERTEHNRVRGCASQVWLVSERRPETPERLYFRGDSDAHLVRGEIAMLMRVFSGRTPSEILAVDPRAMFDRLGLGEALTAQRSNGLFSMISRIQSEARAAQNG